jgi:hypothetical protein
MKHFFSVFFIFLFVSGLVFAQTGESEETLIEQAKAYASEQTPLLDPAVQIPFATRGVTHPLFVGVDDVTIPTYQIDPVTNDTMSAFLGFEVWGAAYDNINDKIYFNNGSTLYEWAVNGAVTQLGTIVDSSAATQSMVSLAWYNGALYGTKNIANEAVWQIDPNTLIAWVVIDYVDLDYDFGGLAVDPTTGEFYGTSDATGASGRGLYRINTDATATLIEPYPTGETDIDGLAISDSRIAYFIIDQPGNFYVYDLVGGTFLPPLTSPWTTSEVFCGGTWNGGIIPVELASFTASVIGNEVSLIWQTATEINNSGFSVERKSTNNEFEEIGFVPGFGSTTEPKSYSFSDQNLENNVYTYRLKQVDFDGTFEYSSEVEVDVNVPATFSLEQNYPNPFNPSTNIKYSVPEAGNVKLSVYNLVGEEVAVLVNGYTDAGQFEVSFDASNLSSGVYLYKLQSANSVITKKMTLLK